MWKATQEEKGERKATIGKESQMGNKTEGRNQEKDTRELSEIVFFLVEDTTEIPIEHLLHCF